MLSGGPQRVVRIGYFGPSQGQLLAPAKSEERIALQSDPSGGGGRVVRLPGGGEQPVGPIHAPPRPIPASRARMTACALSATCSLTRMLETWFLTVFTLTNSCRAISWLLLPCATRDRISSSRSVSSGNARCGAPDRGAEKNPMMRSATPDPKTASPLLTALIAFTTPSPPESFSR